MKTYDSVNYLVGTKQRCRNGFENEVNFFLSKSLLFFILRRLASLGLCFPNFLNISAPAEGYFQKRSICKLFSRIILVKMSKLCGYIVVFSVRKRELFSKKTTQNLDYGSQNVRFCELFLRINLFQNLKIVWVYGRDFCKKKRN